MYLPEDGHVIRRNVQSTLCNKTTSKYYCAFVGTDIVFMPVNITVCTALAICV